MNSTQRDSHGLFSKKNVQAYSLFLQTGRIPQKSIKWYLTWIRQFENSINGKLFSRIAAEDVKAFLSHLSCNDNIQQWQVDQARDSLRLFFRDFLNVPWARAANRTTAAQSDSNIRSQSHMHSDNWTPPHGSDTTAAASLPQLSHQDLLEKLRTEIRVRHYSIRTEQSYEQWVNRFFKYLNNKPVPEVTPADVKRYLEHLAVNKKVAASTQNQALNALVFLFEQALHCWIEKRAGQDVREKPGFRIVVRNDTKGRVDFAKGGKSGLTAIYCHTGPLNFQKSLPQRFSF